MRLIIDGDATPDIQNMSEIAKKYAVDMYVFVDYAHMLNDDDYHVISCEVGHDSVDMAIVNFAKKNDVVVTQDYGLASLLTMKDICVLHTSGNMINEKNVDRLLTSRYLHAHLRSMGQRVKGPSKRTKEDRQKLLTQLETLLKQHL